MEKDKNEYNKIIVFGDELSDKLSILNTFATKQVFEVTLFEDQFDFKSQMVTISKRNFALYDAISFSSCSKSSNIKKKVSLFFDNISSGVKIVIFAISITKFPVNLDSIRAFFNIFKFTNMEKVFFVFTQGDFIAKSEEREERYLAVEEELNALFKSNRIDSDYLRVLYFDEDNADGMNNVLLKAAFEEGRCCLTRNDECTIDDLVNVFIKVKNEEEVLETKDSLWTLFTRSVNSNTMLNNANMML